jgi:hypothetical protein
LARATGRSWALLTATPSRAPVDRLIDITLGCGLSIVSLWINSKVQQRF